VTSRFAFHHVLGPGAVLGDDRPGIPLTRVRDRVRHAYPVAMLASDKAAWRSRVVAGGA